MGSLSRLAPLSGVVAVVLFGTGSAVWALEQPPRDAGTEEVIFFYEGTSIEILIGGTLSVIAVLFFVWFGAVLRERLAAAEGSERTGLPHVAFAGTVITAAVGLGAETINMAGALSAEDGQLTADTAQIYFDVSYALGAPAAGVGIAMVAVPTSLVALRTGRPIDTQGGRLGRASRRARGADARDVDARVRASDPARTPAPRWAQRSAVPATRR